ncbi:uncharacterized protein MEPE_01639 [Melanopsichium pennsylvanicum]|uniref:Uncharacterized protein n=2 Tax=Melanopsichium pennsylvanicum TaxID=63383 RepID=A0AAJ5C3W2_9BASI|nr:putative protein [Melanopsichium pennsylvanicum 4]SNX82933.1 uncharacterized protein MEPE_01639 [Melanopsichium pennsylvanicum]
MSLDAALFTLHFVRRRNQPWIVDIYPTSAGPTCNKAPPVPLKHSSDNATSGTSSKPIPFNGTIPDVEAQRASALESNDFSKQIPSYTRVRATNHTQYSTLLLDGLMNDFLLASISQPLTDTRKKLIQLYNPDSHIELEKKTMTFQQAWRFQFSDTNSKHVENFSWKREGGPSRGSSTQSAYVCEVIRKPDPSVLAAQYRPPAAKCKPATLQLMDYNINRLDVQDKKGIEVALVMSLSALLDQEYDDRIASRGQRNLYICNSGIPTDLSTQAFSSAWQEAEMRHGASQHSASSPSQDARALHHPSESSNVDIADIDRIASLEPNEMLVSKWGSIDEYVQHAIHLLRSDGQGQAMYLITLLSDSVETTPKLVQIAAAIKAAYYRLPDDAKGTVYGRPADADGVEDELYQYVQTLDEEEKDMHQPPASPLADAASRRRIIKLDPPSFGATSPTPPPPPPATGSSSRPSSAPYKPPSKLKIIMSKERIIELEPKKVEDAHSNSTTSTSSSGGGTGASVGQNRLNFSTKPSLPCRPVSPIHSSQSQQQQPNEGHQVEQDKMGKGRALLSKLGLHH